MTKVMLNKEYKDHAVSNPIDSLSLDDLPLNVIDLHSQSIRKLHVTLQVLDEDTKEVIETITGFAESGSINVDGSSLIRRTADIKLSVSDDVFMQPGALLWFNRIVRVYIGIEDNFTGEVYNFLAGTYWIEEGNYSISQNGENIDIKLMDKMFKWEDMQLESPLKIEPGVPISQAIRILMEHIGETDFGVITESELNEVVPYTLDFKVGEEITNIITQLRDMYMEYFCYYNVRGEFEFTKFESQREYDLPEAKWKFDVDDSVLRTLIDFIETYPLRDIRNRVVVYGGTSEKTGLTSYAEARVTDITSPFNVYAIGEKTRIIVENNLSTNEQCMSRAKYEVQKESTFKEVAQIKTIPLYMLDINDVVSVRHPRTGVESKYIVDSFSFGLGVDATMTLAAHKAYYVTLEYGEEKVPLIDAIIKGIANWGWISLGEERIAQCYNIMASGSATLSVGFQDVVVGGEQASVTSYATTKNQTMTIDLADVEGLDFENENGHAEGRSKGDYLDRVIAHEMYHAVTNDYFSHNNMIEAPIWFKEGFGEFLIGAKERFESAYSDKTKADKRKELTNLAQELLDDSFIGTSEEYVSSYLIAVAIYRLAVRHGLWTNLFTNLRSKSGFGINFLYKLLPIGVDNPTVKNMVMQEIRSMDYIWERLFDVNEIDTMSVGGYYFMNIYNTKLNSETVFNNANATVDSIGFKINYIK